MMAWHFVGDTLRDGRPVPKDGVWLRYEGDLVICKAGLHACRHPFDALQYAPGNTLCYVECRGALIEQDDQLVCRERRIVSRMDATEMLRYFARMQALSVIEAWDTDPADVVLDWLMTGDEAVRSAAGSAAESAASAAWSAAESVASAAWASGSAAWRVESAARSAARSAVWSAASAAWGATRSAEIAAGSAVWSAELAAESAARSDFEALVHECFGIRVRP